MQQSSDIAKGIFFHNTFACSKVAMQQCSKDHLFGQMTNSKPTHFYTKSTHPFILQRRRILIKSCQYQPSLLIVAKQQCSRRLFFSESTFSKICSNVAVQHCSKEHVYGKYQTISTKYLPVSCNFWQTLPFVTFVSFL